MTKNYFDYPLTPKRFLFLSIIYFLIIFPNRVFSQKTVGVTKYRQGNLENGYILLPPMNSNKTFLIDKCGKMIKMWKSDYLQGMHAYLLDDGSLLKAGNIADTNYMTAGKGGILEKFSWDGKLLWSYKISNDSLAQHHDFYPMKNGNILVVAWHGIPASEAEARGRKPGTSFGKKLWSERILEIKPKGTDDAEVVWQWSLVDHLVQHEDVLKPDYDMISNHPELVDINYFKNSDPDWIHVNSIDYNAELDQIMITCHHLNEVWVIDHGTTTAEAASHSGGKRGKGGDLLYRWGNPQVYQMGNSMSQKFYGQHNAHWIPKSFKDGGSIMVFNNGLGRFPSFSSVEIFTPSQISAGNYTQNLPYGPSSQSWIYKDSIPSKFYSMVISGAERLPNGNTLICSGVSGKIFEIGKSNTIVWEYINPVITDTVITDGENPTANSVFRCHFYADTFSGFKNKTLTPGNPLEGNPKKYSCNTGNIDITAPVPTMFLPENRTLSNQPNIIPQIDFNENIKKGVSGNIYIYESNVLKETIAISSLKISISQKSLFITPTSLFTKNTKISIALDKNCITDSSNNGIAKVDTSQWTFNIISDAGYNDFNIFSKNRIFPNPAQNYINIYLNHPLCKIEIRNSLGQQIEKRIIEENSDFVKLDISSLTPGVYSVFTGNNIFGVFIKN